LRANSTAQGPITKLARVEKVNKHTQSTKQGKIIITIRIIIVIIIIIIVLLLLLFTLGSHAELNGQNNYRDGNKFCYISMLPSE
jgi:flagellar basal body-associated protein FliL